MTSLLHLDEQSVHALRTAGETGEAQEVTHALRSHDLLTLEALADLAVSLPAESIEHNVGALPDVVADGRAPTLDLELREMILGLETNGAWCVVKNVEQGLVDFPSLRDAREVYLCWHAGEPEIQSWHEVDVGFAGRQPL